MQQWRLSALVPSAVCGACASACVHARECLLAQGIFPPGSSNHWRTGSATPASVHWLDVFHRVELVQLGPPSSA